VVKHYQKVILFLIVNFAALGIGGLLQGPGPMGDWYQALNKAPWTPPGVVFGAAWTLIMICFSFFMAYLTNHEVRNKLIALFSVQFVLNIIWNAVFFKHQMILASLIIIVSLTLLVAYFLFAYAKDLKAKALLIAPYFIWLCIATSLNVYALINN
jgi:translocator protein